MKSEAKRKTLRDKMLSNSKFYGKKAEKGFGYKKETKPKPIDTRMSRSYENMPLEYQRTHLHPVADYRRRTHNGTPEGEELYARQRKKVLEAQEKRIKLFKRKKAYEKWKEQHYEEWKKQKEQESAENSK